MEVKNVIIKSRPLHKFFKKLSDIFKNLSDSRQQTEYAFHSVIYPTANSCIVKFELVNQRRKFELMFQGNFASHYRAKSTDENYIPNDFNFEEVIKNLKNRAHEIN